MFSFKRIVMFNIRMHYNYQVVQAGKGCKPLSINFGDLISFACMASGTRFTALGQLQLILFLNSN
jgi:hypothetical protein